MKSTARLFQERPQPWLRAFLVLTVLLLALGVVLAVVPRADLLVLVLALGGPWFMGWHLAWQMRRLDIRDSTNCMMLFRSNRNAGLIPVLFLAAAVIV